MRLAPLILALAACLSLGACGKAQEAAQEAVAEAATDGKADVDRAGDKTTITTAEGSVTINSEGGQSLPADFPTDAFLPSGYKINTSADLGGARTLEMRVPGSMGDAAKAISEGMQAQSWKQAMSMQQNQMHALMFEKDGRMAQYTISEAADGTHVALSLVSRQP
jgi:hypothetical protein